MRIFKKTLMAVIILNFLMAFFNLAAGFTDMVYFNLLCIVSLSVPFLAEAINKNDKNR